MPSISGESCILFILQRLSIIHHNGMKSNSFRHSCANANDCDVQFMARRTDFFREVLFDSLFNL